MEALQLLKFSIRHGKGLDFTAGTTWEEVEELEHLDEVRHEVPEDHTLFIQSLLGLNSDM
jgi:hypothetical protein